MNEQRPSIALVVTTVSQAQAKEFARKLVEKKVCACVNIIEKVQSVYAWKGEIEVAAESILLCKTTPSRLESCATMIAETHDYDTPEILTYSDIKSSGPYRAFVDAWTLEAKHGAD